MKLKDGIKTCDRLMWASLIMFLAMRISVLVLFNMVADETGADIEAVHDAYEANPVFKALLNLRFVNYILQFIVIPALGFTIYFIFRRKVIEKRMGFDALEFQVMFLFFIIFMNFINDVSSLVGRVI